MSAFDTYTLTADWQVPLPLGQDGTLSVVNLNLGITVTVDVHHRTGGYESVSLTQNGATLVLPLADIVGVRIAASSYPASILFVNTTIPMQVSSPQTFAGSAGGGGTISVEQAGMGGALRQSVMAMTGAALPVPATALANRRKLLLQAAPDNPSPVYLGSSTVTADETATGGAQLAAGASWSEWLSTASPLYAIGAVGTKLIVLEMS